MRKKVFIYIYIYDGYLKKVFYVIFNSYQKKIQPTGEERMKKYKC